MNLRRSSILATAVATLLAAAAATTAGVASAAEIFVPHLVYRSGAYAPNGVPWANGGADYFNMINARDGGINGVKIRYEECETGYATDRGGRGEGRVSQMRHRFRLPFLIDVPQPRQFRPA